MIIIKKVPSLLIWSYSVLYNENRRHNTTKSSQIDNYTDAFYLILFGGKKMRFLYASVRFLRRYLLSYLQFNKYRQRKTIAP